MIFSSFGTLVYSKERDWCRLEIDTEISRYYFGLIPKYKNAHSQAHKAHITVVRKGIENPPNMDVWGKYQAGMVNFQYIPIIQFDGLYYYLESFSDEIGKIRTELGLERYRPGFNCYHITIGNTKNT
jgi:hypothetical protein